MGSAVIELVFWGFLALLVATGIYYVVKLAVRDALREHDAKPERARDPGGRRS